MFINVIVDGQYSCFIFRRSWIPFFTQRAVTFSIALCDFPQSFVQTLRCYLKCALIPSKSFPIHHAQSPSHSVLYNLSCCFAKETILEMLDSYMKKYENNISLKHNVLTRPEVICDMWNVIKCKVEDINCMLWSVSL
jgi:hypothetical protein